MRKFGRLTLSVAPWLALVGAAACSSSPSNSPNADMDGIVPFGSGGSGGASSTPGNNTPGQTGSTTPTGAGGSEAQTATGLTGTAGAPAVATGGAGGAATVMDAAPQAIPPSYFKFGSWQGYAYTDADAPTTTRSVTDFSMLMPTSPFCLSGTVAPKTDFSAYAQIGFHINQAAFGDTPGQDAPALGTTPTGMGVAVNYTKNAGQTLRIQLEGLGATSDDQRWCAELSAPQGPAFVPYTSFRTRCWLAPTDPAYATGSVAYQRQPISAVIMQIPGGNVDPVPYNVCVSGFADGNSETDAPAGGSPAGLLTATISGKAAKAKVLGKDGHEYIINNNAWGTNSSDGSEQLRYTGNSFEILRQSASGASNGSPASFPSIYIGAYGAQSGANGAKTTDNPLPLQVSKITSIPTTFNTSGPLGDNNATYDVWFAPSPPSGQYDTAQSAFLMVWTYKPGSRSPIGNPNGRTGITVQGIPGTWDLWVGPRGGGGPDANLPVLSYVSTSTIRNFTFDLNAFIKDAVGRNQGLTNNMYLTDVFAGFEIWGGGTGLSVDEFSAVVNQ